MSQSSILFKIARRRAVVVLLLAVLVLVSAKQVLAFSASKGPEVAICHHRLSSRLFCSLEDLVCHQENNLAWIHHKDEKSQSFASEESQILSRSAGERPLLSPKSEAECPPELNGTGASSLLHRDNVEMHHLLLEEAFNPPAASQEDETCPKENHRNETSTKNFWTPRVKECYDYQESLKWHGKRMFIDRFFPWTVQAKEHCDVQGSLGSHGNQLTIDRFIPWTAQAKEHCDVQGSLESHCNGMTKKRSLHWTPQVKEHCNIQESLMSYGNNQSFPWTPQLNDFQKWLYAQQDNDYNFNWQKIGQPKLLSLKCGKPQLQVAKEFLQMKTWLPNSDSQVDEICQLVFNKTNSSHYLARPNFDSGANATSSKEKQVDSTQNHELQFSCLKGNHKVWRKDDQCHLISRERQTNSTTLQDMFCPLEDELKSWDNMNQVICTESISEKGNTERQDNGTNSTTLQDMVCPAEQLEDKLQSWDDMDRKICTKPMSKKENRAFPALEAYQDRDYQQKIAPTIKVPTPESTIVILAPDKRAPETFEDDFDPGRNIFLDRPPPPGLEPLHQDSSLISIYLVELHREYHLKTEIAPDLPTRATISAQLEEWKRTTYLLKVDENQSCELHRVG